LTADSISAAISFVIELGHSCNIRASDSRSGLSDRGSRERWTSARTAHESCWDRRGSRRHQGPVERNRHFAGAASRSWHMTGKFPEPRHERTDRTHLPIDRRCVQRSLRGQNTVSLPKHVRRGRRAVDRSLSCAAASVRHIRTFGFEVLTCRLDAPDGRNEGRGREMQIMKRTHQAKWQ
jgi:hypothetical protein